MCLTKVEVARFLFPKGRGCVSLTGGGGKTTFLGIFGHTLKSLGVPVLLTTTTKVQRPFPIDVDWFVEAADPEKLKRHVLSKLRPGILGMAVRSPYGDHKWEGIPPEWVDDLFSTMAEGIILNEADGAYRLPLKAPAVHEPVIPQTTTLIIPVIGMSALGVPLDEAHVFRPRQVSEITGLSLGEPVTEAAMVRLFTHPHGLAKGAPRQTDVVPFLNQVETQTQWDAARRIAQEIWDRSEEIETVLLGRLKPTPVFEILERDG